MPLHTTRAVHVVPVRARRIVVARVQSAAAPPSPRIRMRGFPICRCLLRQPPAVGPRSVFVTHTSTARPQCHSTHNSGASRSTPLSRTAKKKIGKRLGRRPLSDPEFFRTVVQLKAEGHSLRAIAEAVKVSKSFVHKTCQNHLSKSLEFSA